MEVAEEIAQTPVMYDITDGNNVYMSFSSIDSFDEPKARPRPCISFSSIDSFDEPKDRPRLTVRFASLQSYSAVDEFDEPAENKGGLEQSVDSFDKLLADPSVRSPDGNFVMVNTASGRWASKI